MTFLYKLETGSCPKSYGANVARIAGIPQAVALKAAQISQALEDGAGMPGSSSSPAIPHSADLAKLCSLLADPDNVDVSELRKAALCAAEACV